MAIISLTVTESGCYFEADLDLVKVYPITFPSPGAICGDGDDTIQAISGITAGRMLEWSIESDPSGTGCGIDGNGNISGCNGSGIITVQAGDSLLTSCKETADLNVIKSDLSIGAGLICANDGDADNDGIPDFADGFDRDGDVTPNDDDLSSGVSFTPLTLVLPTPIDLPSAQVRFSYPASDPAMVTAMGSDPEIYSLPLGTETLRIWKKDGGVQRNKAEADAGDDFLSAAYDADTHLGFDVGPTPDTVTFYVEGVRPGTGVDEIIVEVDPDGGGPIEFLCMEKVETTVFTVDLDIDSDNSDVLGPMPDRPAEDQIEDITGDPDRPGKIIYANIRDRDNDNIPDFADGFNRDGMPGTADDISEFVYFMPMELTLPEPINLSSAMIRFTYDESIPAQTMITPSYAPGPDTCGSGKSPVMLNVRTSSLSRARPIYPRGPGLHLAYKNVLC